MSDRYVRQARLPQVGAAGQARLAAARVHVVGIGALGCPAADLLARAGVGAGVGEIRLIDRDVVELSNLHRQTLFAERDVGRSKAHAAAERLRDVAGDGVRVEGVASDLSPESVERVLPGLDPGRDVLLDCTDNFETRYLLNDVAVSGGVRLIYAGAVGTSGMVLSIAPGQTACLRCAFPDMPAPGSQPTCETAGVLGPLSNSIGALQAAQAIRAIVEPGTGGVLLSIDAWTLSVQRIELGGPVEGCECCGGRRFPFLWGRESSETRVLCGRDAVHVDPARDLSLDLGTLLERLGPEGTFERCDGLVRGTLSGGEAGLTVFEDGRAIFEGLSDPARARALYARLIGS